MSVESPHRKRLRHYDIPGHVHLLTFSCYQRMALLANGEWRALLSKNIDRATIRHRFHLIAFVYMPEHVHLLVYPHAPSCKIEDLLYAMKKPFSTRIKQLLSYSQCQRAGGKH